MAYYLVYPLLYLVSLLPMPVLYGISSCLNFLLFSVSGYRKEVVLENLRNSFPEKNEAELMIIARQFYSHLADVIVETVKLFSCSRKFLNERVTCDLTLFRNLKKEGKNVIIVMGHTGNWEWAGATIGFTGPYENLNVIYRPVKSAAFDRMMRELRQRFGPVAVPMRGAYKAVTSRDGLHATAFIADQSAPPEHCCWVNFLNQETAVFRGVERIAMKTGHPVVFANVKKLARGRYEVVVENLPGTEGECELTRLHVARLESAIRDQPFNWLWSHRRWKHRKS